MRKNLGFTLIELMVVISIVSIMCAIAIPNFFSWLSSAKLNGAARDLISDLALAKSHALKTNKSIEVVFVNSGYTVFDDKDDDNIADDDEIIREKKCSPGVSMTKVKFLHGKKTQFNRTGSAEAGSVTLTVGNGKNIKVIVNSVGRIRTEV